MASNRHRLRKYQRKKDAARVKRDSPKWNRLANLYWKYWHKVYGFHHNLWEQEDD